MPDYKYTMPDDVLFAYCHAEGCAIGKRKGEMNGFAEEPNLL